MKNLRLFLPAVIITTIIFSGCKKDKESNTDKLTDKNWRMVSKIANPGIDLGAGDFIYDFFNFVPSCSKDDLTKFLDDNTVNFDEGGTKCNSSDPQTTNGTWAFNSDETVLTVMEGTDVKSYTIMALNDDTLKAKYTDTQVVQGVTEVITVIFVNQ